MGHFFYALKAFDVRKFYKVLYALTFYRKYTRSLTFQKFFPGARAPRPLSRILVM
jgi:hypothetical protein